jgi:cell filamentation protein
MKKGGRYDTSGLVEAQFEPGSRGRVLRNRLGIKSSRKMDDVEAAALKAAMEAFVATYDERHRFTAGDICGMHRRWLGAAFRVPALMEDFSRNSLARCTPCTPAALEEIARALAETHVELLLIHPFREGNGRIARALATLMALQAALPPLDFRLIAGRAKNAYFAAVQAGMDRSYAPMAKLFAEIIDRSLAAS